MIWWCLCNHLMIIYCFAMADVSAEMSWFNFFLLLFILVFFCCSGVHISTHLCDMCGVCICRQIYSYVKAIEMRKNWKQYDWFLFLTLSRSLFWCDGFILRWKCGIVFTLAEWVDDWILWWIYKWLMISLEDILGIGTENQVKSGSFS